MSASPILCAGALLLVLLGTEPAPAQPRGQPTDLEKQAALIVPDFANVLRTLDPTKLESITRAHDSAVQGYAKADNTVADAAFRLFWGFYNRSIGSVSCLAWGSAENALLAEVCSGTLRCPGRRVDDFLKSTTTTDNRRRAAAIATVARYRASGIAFDYGEGDFYASPDPQFVSGLAGQLPLGELAEWVRFWAAEQPQRLAEDAGLLVGWDDLRARLARWEAFAKAHPGLPETETEVAPQVKSLVAWYVFGLDNSPAYDRRFGAAPAWTPRIDPKLKASYETFLQENRGSAYYRVVEGIVARVSKAGGAPTKDLVAFLHAELTDPWLREWLRGTRLWLETR